MVGLVLRVDVVGLSHRVVVVIVGVGRVVGVVNVVCGLVDVVSAVVVGGLVDVDRPVNVCGVVVVRVVVDMAVNICVVHVYVTIVSVVVGVLHAAADVSLCFDCAVPTTPRVPSLSMMARVMGVMGVMGALLVTVSRFTFSLPSFASTVVMILIDDDMN